MVSLGQVTDSKFIYFEKKKEKEKEVCCIRVFKKLNFIVKRNYHVLTTLNQGKKQIWCFAYL